MTTNSTQSRDSTGAEELDAVEPTTADGGRNWRRVGAAGVGLAALLALRRRRSRGGDDDATDDADAADDQTDQTASNGGGGGVVRKALASTVVAAVVAGVGRFVRGRWSDGA